MMAAEALRQFGTRSIPAPSFGAIVRSNCTRNAVLSVQLGAGVIDALCRAAEGRALRLVVGLQANAVIEPDRRHRAFQIGPQEREILTSGLDQIDLT